MTRPHRRSSRARCAPAAGALVLAALVALALAGAVLGSFQDNGPLFDDSKHVKTLNKDSYDRLMESKDEVWIIDFYSPWCPHCRDFVPEWEHVAAFYADSPNVRIGAVDCTTNHAVCALEKIPGYPSMKLFHVPATASESVTYYGVKNLRSIVTWVEAALREAKISSGIDPDTIADRIERVLHATPSEPAVAAADTAESTTGNADSDLQSPSKHKIAPVDQVKLPEDTTAAAKDNERTKLDEHSLAIKYTRLRDAGAAFVYALEDGFFMGTDVLEGERYDAALLWIDAVAASFPLEANRAVFVHLAAAARQQDRWEKEAWLAMLEQWKAASSRTTFPKNLLASSEQAGWANCGTYTCGLWTLFHSMSVGVDAPLSAGSQLPTHSPSEVAVAIRAFIQYFFGCENCVKHFLAANPPSAMEEMAQHDSAGPQKVIVWLWRMHNKVNKVTKKGFWPSVAECPECYAEGVEAPSFDPATLNDAGIAAYIQSAYGQSETDVFAMDVQANGLVATLLSAIEGFESLLTAAAIVVAGFGVLMMQSHRLTNVQCNLQHATHKAKRCS